MRIRQLHHVTIKVLDVDEARHFYGTVLGLPCRTDGPAKGPSGAWFDLGDRQLHISKGELPTAMGQHFGVVIEDYASTVADLKASGVPVLKEGAGSTHILDPAGNDIELRPV